MSRQRARWLGCALFVVLLCFENTAELQENPVRVVPVPELSAFTPSFVEGLRAIRARSDRRSDDVFMKVGDSSTVSRGFLSCFATPSEIDLAGRDALRPSIEFFRGGNAAGRDPYRRTSLAAAEGWSARHVLAGNPSPLIAELRATRARFAFVMNGGNDVESRSPFHYGTRMMRIVEQLEQNGVIPILSAVPPRGDDAEANAWVPRFNQVSWAIARARGLPYLDYHQVMTGLPDHGLASDGVHPNALLVNGRARACDFAARGLTFGHNARNLLAIRALHALRQTVVEGAPAPDAEPPSIRGAGTAADPFSIRELPFADIRDTRTEGSADIDVYEGCNADQDESGREIVYRLIIDRPTRVRIFAIPRGDADVDVHLLGPSATGAACVERADRELVRELTPGTWHVAIDTFAGGGSPQAGEVLVLIAPE